MALNDYETSQESGQPVELYRFVYGTNAGRDYTYTNAEEDILYDGLTYTALPLTRDKIKTKGRAAGKEITVEVPMSSAVSELFRVFPPGRVVAVTIRQGHVRNPNDSLEHLVGENFPLLWTGRVLESRRNGNVTTLTCESSETGMKRVGLRRHYQWPCPLVLYGNRCAADKAIAKITTTATASGNVLTVPVSWYGTNLAADYLGGVVEWDSVDGRESRTIIRTGATSLTLNATPAGFTSGGNIDVFLGCPHTLAGCTGLHNNTVNYGGQPFIPLVNPVGKNNHT